jgi:tetratricopeptide (TPR) repeat protein
MKKSAPNPLLQDAMLLHQRGAILEATARYFEILRHDPRNVDALFFLGLASAQHGRFSEAVKSLRKAVKIAPKHTAAYILLAEALKELGEADEALKCFDRAIALQPELPNGHVGRGNLLLRLARPQQAFQAFDRAASMHPDSVEAWNGRGNSQAALGRHKEAIASFDRAILLSPDSAEIHANRGSALATLGLHEDALASFDRALAANPNFSEVHVNKGNSLSKLDRHEEALSNYDRAITIRPNLAEAHLSRGFVLHQAQRFGDALQSFDRALALDRSLSDAHVARALTLRALKRFDEALASCDAALALKPEVARSWQQRSRILCDLGRDSEALAAADRAIAQEPKELAHYQQRVLVLTMMGRLEDTLETFDRMITIAPESANIHADRMGVCNALGRFEEAFAEADNALRLAPDDDEILYKVSLIERLHGRWIEGSKKYESRLKVQTPIAPPPYPRWNGEAPNGELLLLVGEQGLGDRIQYASYIPQLIRDGYRVAVWTDAKSAALLSTIGGLEAAISDIEALEASTGVRWVPMASLPHIFQTTPDSVPRTAPFLTVDSTRVDTWRQKIGSDGFKVGINWQGNSEYRFDKLRSISLHEFALLTAIPEVRLISLHNRPRAEQIGALAFGHMIETPLPQDSSGEALLDAAAVMMNLDLVVTSDTMVAHLAGALGCPTMVALPLVPDWRWLLAGDISPWYPSLRLFRQVKAGDWGGVVARIAAAVREKAVASAQLAPKLPR